MPVMTTPTVKLNGPQIGELVSILIAAFNYFELEEAVRTGLDLELAALLELLRLSVQNTSLAIAAVQARA